MKAVRITELDTLNEFPVGYILKNAGLEELTGCCPKSFFNFFGLLGVIEELNSSFLFWLIAELQEDEKTLLTPVQGINNFIKHPIFNNLDCGGGFIYERTASDLLNCLAHDCVMWAHLFPNGTSEPSHCEVYHFKQGRLFCNGVEIDGRTFNIKIFCHPKNQYILGRPLNAL